MNEEEFELKKHVWDGKQFFEVPLFVVLRTALRYKRTVLKGFRRMEAKAIVPQMNSMILLKKRGLFTGSVFIELKGERSSDPSVTTFNDTVLYSKVHKGGRMNDSIDQLNNYVSLHEGRQPSELYFWNRQHDVIIFGKV